MGGIAWQRSGAGSVESGAFGCITRSGNGAAAD